MSNGARHGLGVLAGVIATPLVGAGLALGFERLEEHRRHYVQFASTTSTGLVAGAVLALTAVVVAVLVASRLSPLASLIPGVAFAAYGVVWLLKPIWASDKVDVLPDRYTSPVMTMSLLGVPFLVGVVLLAGSLVPSRWRSRAHAAAAPQHLAGPPPGMPGAPRPMYGREQQQQYGHGPGAVPPPYGQPQSPGASPSASRSPSPSPSPSASPGPGGYPVPGSSQAPPPPPPPAKPSQGSPSSSDDEPGEWTRMYGGDDLRDGGGSR
ncbi:hypothetical protein SMC26_25935 [Actinomadura fulvescens]|uniref:Uncharacterized protein n=1 Tax=Actinomadura fulvescens TaxID=46160 RepID=A0ABN3QE17_9ACTN